MTPVGRIRDMNTQSLNRVFMSLIRPTGARRFATPPSNGALRVSSASSFLRVEPCPPAPFVTSSHSGSGRKCRH